jgi:hypothetical protein
MATAFEAYEVLVTRIVVSVLVLALAGCGSEAGDQREPNRHSISPQQYERVQVGMPRWVVRGLLGDPADERDMEIAEEDLPYSISSGECIDYMERYEIVRYEDERDYVEDGEPLTAYSFCFDDNRLESKTFGYTGTEAEEAGVAEECDFRGPRNECG